MAIIDPSSSSSPMPASASSGPESELMRLWGLIGELSEQLTQNRAAAVSLYTQAGSVKNQAVHNQTGYVLRRFNLDIPQDKYDAELARMTQALTAENNGLVNDNKQLNSLIRDYEQALEGVMSAFRNQARDVQEHELELIRSYESQIIAREDADATVALSNTTAVSEALTRLSHILRQYMRTLGGEPMASPDPLQVSVLDTVGASCPSDRDKEEWERERSRAEGEAAAWALERECELSRLEAENEVLRRMMGLLPPLPPASAQGEGASGPLGIGRGVPPPIARAPSALPVRGGGGGGGGGLGSRLGPYGTFKASSVTNR